MMMRSVVALVLLTLCISPLISGHLHGHSQPHHPSSHLITKHSHESKDVHHVANVIRSIISPKTSQTCDTCQSIWGTVVGVLGNNATYPTIVSFLDQVCSILGPQYAPTCDTLVAKLVDILPFAMHEAHILNLDDPIAVCSILSICTVTCCTDNIPQQVHLALTGDMSQMQVTWVTLTTTPTSVVEYGNFRANLSSQVTGSSYTYSDGGWVGTIHTATMTGLVSNTTYYYQVGDPVAGFSRTFQFQTLPASRTEPLRYAVVGDLGVVEGTDTINDMIAAAQQGEYDVVIHIGDISYANGYQKLWDDFFREIEPVASRIPYMVIPGNHELPFNFTSYISRFPMPGATSGSQTNLYYSIDIGCTHFIAIDSESVINTPEITDRQLAWLKNDIAQAAHRHATGTPGWLIVYMHRPLYCTNTGWEGDCGVWAQYLRDKLEDIFYQNHVDFVLAGHQHDYERMHPMYRSSVDAKGPVYVVNGAGGNREDVETDFGQPAPAWSAYRVSEWGWGLLTINSPTEMEWIFQAAKGDTIHDKYTFKRQ